MALDWRSIKVFLAGWIIGSLFWIPLTILLMRVMAQMGVAQNNKMIRFMQTPTWAHRINTWLRQFIYGERDA